MTQPEHLQRGFAAIAAIFLVVILAALGGFMLTFSNAQQRTSAQDVQGTRAYWAARAGLEWGIASAAVAVACPASPTNLAIEGFAVAVTCTSAVFVDNGNRTIFQLNATASAGGVVGGAGFVERSVSASFE